MGFDHHRNCLSAGLCLCHHIEISHSQFHHILPILHILYRLSVDLDHHKNIIWGINWSIPSGEVITGASLFFDNICNWNNNPNDLWVHLLDPITTGLQMQSDGQGGR